MKNLNLYSPLLKLLEKHQSFDWMPNNGNWGDGMIKTGSELLFSHMNLNPNRVYKVGSGKTFVYGGGGAWCRFFNHAIGICLQACEHYETVVVLPSTYETPPTPSDLPKNLILLARDNVSLKFTQNDFPAIPDMAFLLPAHPVEVTRKKLNAWRTNQDTNPNRSSIPHDNVDISCHGCHDTPIDSLLNFVGSHQEVETDRMHIGIAAAIQGVERIVLRPNGYHKLQSSYESFSDLYPVGTVFEPW